MAVREVCLLLLLAVWASHASEIRNTIFTKFAEDDFTFGDGLLVAMAAVSGIDCGRKCSETGSCLSFTFTEGAAGGMCRLHSVIFTAQASEKFSTPGTTAFNTPTDTPVSICGVKDGWTVFQRRMDGSVDFYRTWAEYGQGFGDPCGEFWLGLEALHQMTLTGNWTLRVDLGDWEGNTAYATYTGFRIASESEKYKLLFDRYSYSGTAGDSLGGAHEVMFSTRDADNDSYASYTGSNNTAVEYGGAWWFRSAMYCHLNGQYQPSSNTPEYLGILWKDWRGTTYSLKTTEMMIKMIQ